MGVVEYKLPDRRTVVASDTCVGCGPSSCVRGGDPSEFKVAVFEGQVPVELEGGELALRREVSIVYLCPHGGFLYLLGGDEHDLVALEKKEDLEL